MALTRCALKLKNTVSSVLQMLTIKHEYLAGMHDCAEDFDVFNQIEAMIMLVKPTEPQQRCS